jgi:putative transposase
MDMPMEHKRKRKSVAAQTAAQEPLPELPAEVLDKLVTGPMKPSEVKALMRAFNKALIERAVGAELSHHLGYKPGGEKPEGQANERNGASGKTVLTEHGSVRISVPRDRDGTFEPILIPKHARRFTGFDEHIIAMYARGMSVREIQGFIVEAYGTQVSPDFISSVTDEVMAEAFSWQSRALDRMYPVVFFDALRVKIRTDGLVTNKAVYLALGVQADGKREVLGLWIEQTEGAKFWLKVFNDLRNRGCQDILIAVVDGLKGLPEAITTVFPKTTVQTCIVHLIRNSLDYAGWRDRKAMAQALRPIYTAASAEAALAALEAFENSSWGTRYPPVVQAWRRAWEYVTPFFAFSKDIRRVIYTTNAIESLNMRLRKIIKTRGHFPNDEAAVKLLWLALTNALRKTVRPTFDWKAAMNQFAIQFGDRYTEARG